MSQWSVYVVKAADDSLYTGIATDVARRLREHNEGRIGARYLARFNVVYDFPGERMFLSPRTAGGQAGP